MTDKTSYNEKQKRATCFECVSKLSPLAGIKMPQQCIKGPKSHFGLTTVFFYEICLMLSEILLSGVQSNIMYSTCVQFPLGSSGYWGVRLRTLCIFFKYLVHNGFPLKNQGNKCRNNKGNSNPLFKLANDREQVTRVLSSPSEQLLGKGLKQQAGLNKRHKKNNQRQLTTIKATKMLIFWDLKLPKF